MKKEDFKIEVKDNFLTISGERKFVNEDNGLLVNASQILKLVKKVAMIVILN